MPTTCPPSPPSCVATRIAGLQFADAALAHLAERENIRTVFTPDRRDFSIIRLKRNRTLTLLPEVQ